MHVSDSYTDGEYECYEDDDALSEVFSVVDLPNSSLAKTEQSQKLNSNTSFIQRRKLISYKGVFNNSKRFDGVDPIVCQTPIFQQVSEEICVLEALGLSARSMLHKKHILWISKLLHKLILDGDWENAAKAFLPVTQLAKIMPTQLWRIGIEILQRNDKGQQYLAKFFEAMLRLNPKFSTEIIITGLVDLLKNNQEDGIHRCQQLLVETSSYRFIKQDTLYNYYCGVIYYCLWRMDLIKQLNQHCDNSVPADELVNIMKTRIVFKELEIRSSQMDYFCSKALKSFEDLTKIPGIIDIFITKYVEMLLFSYEDIKALDVLKSYAVLNPNNPNAHRYLIWLLEQTNDKSDVYMSTLDNLSRIDPTGSKSIDSMEKLYQNGQLKNLIDLLFDRLDDYSFYNSTVDWAWLCFLIVNSNTTYISHCFDERIEWWIKFHFKTKQHLDYSGESLPLNEDVLAMKRFFVINIIQDDLPPPIHQFIDYVNDVAISGSLFEQLDILPACVQQYLPDDIILESNDIPCKRSRTDSTSPNG